MDETSSTSSLKPAERRRRHASQRQVAATLSQMTGIPEGTLRHWMRNQQIMTRMPLRQQCSMTVQLPPAERKG